uniref:BTB domain-containing protein n=1 Tax=Panagrellus redivivus TaxID=6233 RepID=A0A7E4WDH6_PANRE
MDRNRLLGITAVDISDENGVKAGTTDGIIANGGSDVTIVVDNVELPAHRDILVQRCRYFEALFNSGMIEATSKRIEIRETSIDGFKSVLRYIYTGDVKFTSINSTFDALRLAQMYEFEREFEDIAVDFLKKACTDNNVCFIFNEAILLSLDALTDFTIEYMNIISYNTRKCENFDQLSLDALNEIITRVAFCVPDIELFHSVVGWMKVNPSKSAAFTDILENVILDSITVKEMTALPSDVLKAVVQLIQQRKTAGKTYCFKNKNVAALKYGAKVLTGGTTSFFEENAKEVSNLTNEFSDEGILIDLGHRFKLNSFELHLNDEDTVRSYFYWIDVSEDNINWNRVIDHSKYPSHRLQKLYFEPRPVRFVRIYGRAPRDCVFEIARFCAFYTTELFEVDSKTTLRIPSDSVTLHESNIRFESLEGPFDAYFDYGPNVYKIGLLLQLSQPYLIDSVAFKVIERDAHAFRYIVEISTDLICWTRVFHGESKGSCYFKKQPVVFVKITGIFNDKNDRFDRVFLDCPAITK